MNYPFANTLVMIAELAIKPDKLKEFLDYTVTNLGDYPLYIRRT